MRQERQRLAAEKEEQLRRWNLPSTAPPLTAAQSTIDRDERRPGSQSPPEKLQPEAAFNRSSTLSHPDADFSRSSTLPSRLSLSKQPLRALAVDRKEETLVARSSYGSTSSLTDAFRQRATPLGARKSFPIQPKPNIKSELMGAPLASSPSVSLRVRNLSEDVLACCKKTYWHVVSCATLLRFFRTLTPPHDFLVLSVCTLSVVARWMCFSASLDFSRRLAVFCGFSKHTSVKIVDGAGFFPKAFCFLYELLLYFI